jgi:ribosomal protein S18 acetylase RimI-like enzyme
VTEGNSPALRLYERLGFADTGRRDVLPSNPALQTIQMALNL